MERLRKWLADTGTSQKDFAESLTIKVTQAAVSQWLAGKQIPRGKTLRAISARTGLTIDDLLDNTASDVKRPAA